MIAYPKLMKTRMHNNFAFIFVFVFHPFARTTDLKRSVTIQYPAPTIFLACGWPTCLYAVSCSCFFFWALGTEASPKLKKSFSFLCSVYFLGSEGCFLF